MTKLHFHHRDQLPPLLELRGGRLAGPDSARSVWPARPFTLRPRGPARYRQNRGVLIAPKVSCLSVQLDEKESSRLQIEIKVQGDHSACSKPPVPFWPGQAIAEL